MTCTEGYSDENAPCDYMAIESQPFYQHLKRGFII